MIEINAYPNLQYEDEIELFIKKNMLTDFVDLYIEQRINNTEPKQGGWILCNPLYDTTWVYKVMNLEIQKNFLYKHVDNYDFLYNNSIVFSPNYFSKNIYNNEDSLNYLTNKTVCIVDNRKYCYNFMKKYNILNLSPKTYLSVNDIENDTNTYYLKTNNSCAQRGVYIGNKEYLNNLENKIKINSIIQEQVSNQLIVNNKKVIFGVYYFIINNKIFLFKNQENISVNSEAKIDDPSKVKMEYDTLLFTDLKDCKRIHNSIINCVSKFLSCYKEEIAQFNNNNKIAIARLDIIINSEFDAKILEVNSSQVGMLQNLITLPEIVKILMKYVDNFMFKLPNNITDNLIEINS